MFLLIFSSLYYTQAAMLQQQYLKSQSTLNCITEVYLFVFEVLIKLVVSSIWQHYQTRTQYWYHLISGRCMIFTLQESKK